MAERRSGVDSPHDELRASLDGLPTEAGGDAGADYDERSTRDLVERMADGDEAVPIAVKAAAGAIAGRAHGQRPR